MSRFCPPISCIVICVALSAACKKNDPWPYNGYQAPESFKSYLFFPEGSWWHYQCMQDSTVDTLQVTESAIVFRSPREFSNQVNSSTTPKEETLNQHSTYSNQNGVFEVGLLEYTSAPLADEFAPFQNSFADFRWTVNSANGSFKPQDIFFFPFKSMMVTDGNEKSYKELQNATIQGQEFPEVLVMKNMWMDSDFENPPVEEWYVANIGVVKFTLKNGYSYELIDHQISN